VEEAAETGGSAREILGRRARELGEELGAGAPGPTAALEEHGFEPRTEDGEVLLGNCPFQGLAQAHTRLVCEMNLALVAGLLTGVGSSELTARLEPRPGLCCVRLTP
jgi:predicted ArsR family transcriptional regulator